PGLLARLPSQPDHQHRNSRMRLDGVLVGDITENKVSQDDTVLPVAARGWLSCQFEPPESIGNQADASAENCSMEGIREIRADGLMPQTARSSAMQRSNGGA
ncbi:hypothetical protein, partial [Streptomyces sp. NPDC004658]|uniref:hypothetical protein n=1 Tax=Streptomyces sp. NPDC004658 TaxID=3154672 RepID=UPI0033B56526